MTELQFYRPTSEFAAHADILAAHFRAHPCATLAEACAAILKGLGLKRRRVYPVPAKVDPERQEVFLK